MKQIKFFSSVLEDSLQKDVNSFIQEQYDIFHKDVIDIRYNTFVNEHGHDEWTVMVIYER